MLISLLFTSFALGKKIRVNLPKLGFAVNSLTLATKLDFVLSSCFSFFLSFCIACFVFSKFFLACASWILAVLFFSVGLYVIFELNEGLIEGYKSGAKAFLLDRKEIFLKEFSQEQLEDQIAAVDSITTVQLLFSTFWKKIIAGFLITPVVAIILRKKPK